MDVASTFFLGQESIRRAPAPVPSATATTAGINSMVSRNASVPPPRSASSFASARTGTLQSRFEKLVYASPMPLSIMKYYSSTQTPHVPGPVDNQPKRPDIPTIPSMAAAAPVVKQNKDNKQINTTEKENTPAKPTPISNARLHQARPASRRDDQPSEPQEAVLPKTLAPSASTYSATSTEAPSKPPPRQPSPILAHNDDDVESLPIPGSDETTGDVVDDGENADLQITASESKEVPLIQESTQENDLSQPLLKRKGKRVSAPSPVLVAEKKKPSKRRAVDEPPQPIQPTAKRQRKSLDAPAKSAQDNPPEVKQSKRQQTSITKEVANDSASRPRRGRKSAPAAIESTVKEAEPTILPSKQSTRSSTQLKTPAKPASNAPVITVSHKKSAPNSAPPAQKVERRGRPPTRAGASGKTPSKAAATNQRIPKSTRLSQNEAPNKVTKSTSASTSSKTPPAKKGGVDNLRKSNRRHSAPRDYWVIGSEPRSPVYREAELGKRSFS